MMNRRFKYTFDKCAKIPPLRQFWIKVTPGLASSYPAGCGGVAPTEERGPRISAALRPVPRLCGPGDPSGSPRSWNSCSGEFCGQGKLPEDSSAPPYPEDAASSGLRALFELSLLQRTWPAVIFLLLALTVQRLTLSLEDIPRFLMKKEEKIKNVRTPKLLRVFGWFYAMSFEVKNSSIEFEFSMKKKKKKKS